MEWFSINDPILFIYLFFSRDNTGKDGHFNQLAKCLDVQCDQQIMKKANRKSWLADFTSGFQFVLFLKIGHFITLVVKPVGSYLQLLPTSMSLRTSSVHLTSRSCSPTTCTCCLPSSRTRSFAFLLSRSNTCTHYQVLMSQWGSSIFKDGFIFLNSVLTQDWIPPLFTERNRSQNSTSKLYVYGS